MVESEINELAMKARFKTEVSGSDEEGNWSARGFDRVQYLISANPGEPLGPVEEIASGGELSRVMLALKTSVEAGQSTRASATAALAGDHTKSSPTGLYGAGAPPFSPASGERVGSQRTLVFD